MIEQQGRVVGVGDGRISVRIGASTGCSACDAGKGCGAGLFGRLLRRKPVVLDFDNSVDAGPGQAVVVGLPEAVFLRLVLRLYLYPLMAGLLGAVFGHLVARALQFSELTADLLVLGAALVAAFATVRVLRSRSAEFSAGVVVHLLRTVSCDFKDNQKEVIS